MKEKERSRLFRKAFFYLKKHGLVKTQKELAEKIGIGATPVSHLMQGTSLPSAETLLKMNEAFGGIFNLDYFVGGSDVMLAEDLKEEEKGQPGFGAKSYLDEIVTMLMEKVTSARAGQLKNEEGLEFKVKADYAVASVSVTRLK